VVAIPDCQAHHPAIASSLHVLQAALDLSGVEPYCHENHEGESSNPGSLSHVQLTVERSSALVQLVLVWHAESPDEVPFLESLAGSLWTCSGNGDLPWHSVWANFRGRNESGSRFIFSKPRLGCDDANQWVLLRGPPAVNEAIADLMFSFGPGVFRQPNLDMFETLVQQAKAMFESYVLKHQARRRASLRILELYSGAGVLGLSLVSVAGGGATLLSTDCSPHCAVPFKNNAATVLGSKARASFRAMDASEAIALAEKERVNIVVVDPPRRGLGCTVTACIGATASIEAVVYVSCNPATFCSDANDLFASGFSIKGISIYDSFPGTKHAEVLGVFSRAAATGHWHRQPKSR